MTTSRSKSPKRRNRGPSPYALGVGRHRHLVEARARRIRATLPSCVQYEDLLQDGHRGLMQAIAAYDPTAGVAFGVHAAPFIDRRIVDGLRRSYRQRLDPLTDALGGHTGDDDGDAPATACRLPDGRAASPVDGVIRAEIRAALADRLSKEEALILRATLVDNAGQAEIAAMLGWSPSRVGRKLARLLPPLLARLRASPRLQELAGLPTELHARGVEGPARAGRQGCRRTDADGGAGGQARRRPAQDGNAATPPQPHAKEISCT